MNTQGTRPIASQLIYDYMKKTMYKFFSAGLEEFYQNIFKKGFQLGEKVGFELWNKLPIQRIYKESSAMFMVILTHLSTVPY